MVRGTESGSHWSPVSAVSYTHLDVYKRQGLKAPLRNAKAGAETIRHPEDHRNMCLFTRSDRVGSAVEEKTLFAEALAVV